MTSGSRSEEAGGDATSASLVTRNGRVSGVSNGLRSAGVANCTRLRLNRAACPSSRAAARRSERNTLALADRSVSVSRPEAWAAQTESAHAIAAAEERRIGQFIDDSKQVMCIEQKRQITGWRLSDKGDVEASLKRLRGAAGATCREAGWIAEARPHYFMEISKSFQNV
ncbi:hypothetical protein KPB06_31355 [Burkholderia semiarida]|nr:hypothetical protein [Burkholderia semiarida]MDF3104713.1 hypothetical protein [Burkholderia semiarida]WJN74937.1 hypothetical protein OH687_31990 [Burkholderia anthina]